MHAILQKQRIRKGEENQEQVTPEFQKYMQKKGKDIAICSIGSWGPFKASYPFIQSKNQLKNNPKQTTDRSQKENLCYQRRMGWRTHVPSVGNCTLTVSWPDLPLWSQARWDQETTGSKGEQASSQIKEREGAQLLFPIPPIR